MFVQPRSNDREMLGSIVLNVSDLIDDLLFDYQHGESQLTNPSAFTKTKDAGEWIMCCCPNHSESHPSFGILKEAPYHCNCFYCGYLGTIDKVIESTFNLHKNDGIMQLLNKYTVGAERAKIDVKTIIESRREPTKNFGLEESVLNRFRRSQTMDYKLYDKAISYMLGRGLSIDTLSTYEIGVDIETNCIVFPQRTFNGELRFLQKRKVGDDFVGAKFINDGNAKKKDILFGLHFINKFKYDSKKRISRVRIVESPIDAMSNYEAGYAAVALNGKLLFKQQIEALIKSGITTVDLMLDNDKAGYLGMLKASKLLDKEGLVVNRIIYPNHFYKDSNALLQNNLLHNCGVRNVNLVGNLN